MMCSPAGSGADVLVFGPGSGIDTITDFKDGLDRMVFEGASCYATGISSAA
ncbi:hypothetical protein ATO8_19274 [Roseivivax marinus]|uniref:Uncharacterized protein n=1 Tax=Roseivivax marinus TaxID=1379903 RepID=W4HE61_9RHOB|nr:hypothetical protein ATO8_19274 [Roseivivax marinus]